MPPVNEGRTLDPVLLKELRDIQTQLFDKASNYTRLVFGLGYGGFFAFWSGSKQYLSPREVVFSALLMAFSLLLFILFEVFRTGMLSHLAVRWTKAVSVPEARLGEALEQFRQGANHADGMLTGIWVVVFYLTAITGFGGAGILVYGFVRWLLSSL